MAFSAILFTVTLPTVDGDPLDWSSNSFAFQSASATPEALAADVFGPLKLFYSTAGTGGTHPVAAYLGQQLSRADQAMQFKAYNITGHLNGTPHGSPIFMGTDTLGASLGEGYIPEACAMVLSFHSAYGADVEFGTHTRPRARDRGRVYLGPIDKGALDNSFSAHRMGIKAAARTSIGAAAADLAAGSFGASLGEWVVWSRVSAITKIVSGGWVDDRVDYQRRREDQGLVRTTWVAA